jgi:hypothetical protein
MPMPNAGQPHAVVVLQQPATMPIPHFGQDDATHAAPPELELALLPPAQAPFMHIIPVVVQSVQAAPPVPQ